LVGYGQARTVVGPYMVNRYGSAASQSPQLAIYR